MTNGVTYKNDLKIHAYDLKLLNLGKLRTHMSLELTGLIKTNIASKNVDKINYAINIKDTHQEYKLNVFFKKTNFSKKINFSNNKNIGIIRISDCEFSDDLNYTSNCVINEASEIKNTEFRKSINLLNAQFKSDFTFHNNKLNENLNLSNSTFDRFAEITNNTFNKTPEIRGTKFNDIITFDGSAFPRNNLEIRDDFTYRKLKKILEEQKNNYEATTFNAYELNIQWKKYPIKHKIFSLNTLYRYTTAYNQDWLRPIIFIFSLSFICWVFYSEGDLIEMNLPANPTTWEKAVGGYKGWEKSAIFSISTILPTNFLGHSHLVPKSFLGNALATFQSTLNIIFLAMSIISIRRRFKIF